MLIFVPEVKMISAWRDGCPAGGGIKVAAIASGEVPPKAGKPTVAEVSYWVYILKSKSCGRFYVGHCADYSKRLQEHNSFRVRSTKAFAPWDIVHLEKFESKSEAFSREMKIKSYKSGEAFKKLIDISEMK